MTATNLTRRTALAGSVALPLAPAAAMAQNVSVPNATDAAWAELQAAKAEDRVRKTAYRAWEAENVPERLHHRNFPRACDFADKEQWHTLQEAWHRERNAYRNPYEMDDDELDAFVDRLDTVTDAILDAPAATLTDLKRKLIVIRDEDVADERRSLNRLIADVQALDGRAV